MSSSNLHGKMPVLDVPCAPGHEWLACARSGVVSRLEAMLESDPRCKLESDSFGTALHWAAAQDHGKAIKWLLRAGVPLEAQNAHGHTALTRPLSAL